MAKAHGSKKEILVPSARELSRELTRSLLKAIYERAATEGRIPTPDVAMEEFHALVAQLAGNADRTQAQQENFPLELARFDVSKLNREAHHFAVDLYYNAIRPSRGAPPLRPEYLTQIVDWHSKGLSPRQIAIKMGLKSSDQSTDKVRKQLRAAKNRTGKK